MKKKLEKNVKGKNTPKLFPGERSGTLGENVKKTFENVKKTFTVPKWDLADGARAKTKKKRS